MATQPTTDHIPDGTRVDYHGSHTDLHGTYEARVCSCTLCFSALVRLGREVRRYELVEPGTGESPVFHVRRKSITRL